ncbi:MAG: hypothetical protein P8M32_04495 [Phycisphaerales bacterium]|nr:hypothetical protein [Phycisphaerales bacterium]
MSEHDATENGPTEGLEVSLNAQTRPAALDWAHYYRGDVTLITTNGDEHVGYLFDQSNEHVRLDPTDGSPRVRIAQSDLATIRFSGRDTAAGKSFERWIDRYITKTLAGEDASIDSEPTEE